MVGTIDVFCVHVGIWYDGYASPHNAMRNIYCRVRQDTATSAHWMVSDPNFRLEEALLHTITASLSSLTNFFSISCASARFDSGVLHDIWKPHNVYLDLCRRILIDRPVHSLPLCKAW